MARVRRHSQRVALLHASLTRRCPSDHRDRGRRDHSPDLVRDRDPRRRRILRRSLTGRPPVREPLRAGVGVRQRDGSVDVSEVGESLRPSSSPAVGSIILREQPEVVTSGYRLIEHDARLLGIAGLRQAFGEPGRATQERPSRVSSSAPPGHLSRARLGNQGGARADGASRPPNDRPGRLGAGLPRDPPPGARLRRDARDQRVPGIAAVLAAPPRKQRERLARTAVDGQQTDQRVLTGRRSARSSHTRFAPILRREWTVAGSDP